MAGDPGFAAGGFGAALRALRALQRRAAAVGDVLRRLGRLYRIQAIMDLNMLRRDTRTALVYYLSDMLSNAAGMSGMFLLAWRFGGVSDMSRWEVLFMLGFSNCMTGVAGSLFMSNNSLHISRRIGRGQWDHLMIKPVPYAMQLATESFTPFTGCINLLFGLAIALVALRGLAFPATPLWWLAFWGSAFAGCAVVAGLSYAFGALAFWKPAAFEEISTAVVDDLTGPIKDYPLSGMPAPVVWLLLTALPSGLMGWFPALALQGKAPLGLPAAYTLAVAALLWALALLLFRKGLRHYATIGSGRYKAIGHRR